VPQPPGTVGTPGPRHDQLRQLEQVASGCTRCRLAEGRTQVVFGNGNPRGDLMLIGEAPGAQEDRQGEPFVGRSGQLVDCMLKGIGLRREAVYVTNVIKCRPPENRDPRADEIQACHPYLDEQVRLVDPKVVVTLGNFASRTLLGTTTGITRLRGRTYPWQGRTLVPTFHPAAALRAAQRPDAPEMAGLEEDFQTVARLLAELDRPAAPPDPEPRTRADGALLRRHAQPQP
jgi:uracil-DNA glycosylase